MPTKPLRPETYSSKVVYAAGAIVWRRHRGQLQVLLVHRPRYMDWSWPKGKLAKRESFQAGAVREVYEETGLHVILGRPLPSVRYRLPGGKMKHNYYWAAEVAAPDFAPLRARKPAATASIKEIDAVAWVNIDDAHHMLTRKSDRKPLKELEKFYEKRQLETRLLIVARHGRAMKRSAWQSDENTRPLTKEGTQQAKALVPLLAAYGVDEVISSPWERCAQTLTPYAQKAKIDLNTASVLTESAHEKSRQKTKKFIQQQLSTPSRLAFCTHRPVLPTLIETLQELEHYHGSRLPDQDPYLRVGNLLVVHLSLGRTTPRVFDVELLRPVDE